MCLVLGQRLQQLSLLLPPGCTWVRETLTTALTKLSGTPGALGLAEHHDHLVAKVRLHPLKHLDRVRLDRTVDASKQVCGDSLALSSAPRPAVPLVRAVGTTTTTTRV